MTFLTSFFSFRTSFAHLRRLWLILILINIIIQGMVILWNNGVVMLFPTFCHEIFLCITFGKIVIISLCFRLLTVFTVLLFNRIFYIVQHLFHWRIRTKRWCVIQISLSSTIFQRFIFLCFLTFSFDIITIIVIIFIDFGQIQYIIHKSFAIAKFHLKIHFQFLLI
jgi:hypothetical protein